MLGSEPFYISRGYGKRPGRKARRKLQVGTTNAILVRVEVTTYLQTEQE